MEENPRRHRNFVGCSSAVLLPTKRSETFHETIRLSAQRIRRFRKANGTCRASGQTDFETSSKCHRFTTSLQRRIEGITIWYVVILYLCFVNIPCNQSTCWFRTWRVRIDLNDDLFSKAWLFDSFLLDDGFILVHSNPQMNSIFIPLLIHALMHPVIWIKNMNINPFPYHSPKLTHQVRNISIPIPVSSISNTISATNLA